MVPVLTKSVRHPAVLGTGVRVPALLAGSVAVHPQRLRELAATGAPRTFTGPARSRSPAAARRSFLACASARLAAVGGLTCQGARAGVRRYSAKFSPRHSRPGPAFPPVWACGPTRTYHRAPGCPPAHTPAEFLLEQSGL